MQNLSVAGVRARVQFPRKNLAANSRPLPLFAIRQVNITCAATTACGSNFKRPPEKSSKICSFHA